MQGNFFPHPLSFVSLLFILLLNFSDKCGLRFQERSWALNSVAQNKNKYVFNSFCLKVMLYWRTNI